MPNLILRQAMLNAIFETGPYPRMHLTHGVVFCLGLNRGQKVKTNPIQTPTEQLAQLSHGFGLRKSGQDHLTQVFSLNELRKPSALSGKTGVEKAQHRSPLQIKRKLLGRPSKVQFRQGGAQTLLNLIWHLPRPQSFKCLAKIDLILVCFFVTQMLVFGCFLNLNLTVSTLRR